MRVVHFSDGDLTIWILKESQSTCRCTPGVYTPADEGKCVFEQVEKQKKALTEIQDDESLVSPPGAL